ncbi:MAG: hypothetical protein HYZ34_06225 [Ignavibacteriae bacterium]|nr:hypothetical protein [Ignavibacteriota bacterium]
MEKLQQYWQTNNERKFSGRVVGDGCGKCLFDFNIEGMKQKPLSIMEEVRMSRQNNNYRFINK